LIFALTLVGGEGNRLVEIHTRNWNAAVGSGFLDGALKEATQNRLVADLRRLCAATRRRTAGLQNRSFAFKSLGCGGQCRGRRVPRQRSRKRCWSAPAPDFRTGALGSDDAGALPSPQRPHIPNDAA